MLAVKVAIILTVLMVAVTLIGRPLARLLPYRLQPRSVLYLSPALGLSLLVLVSSYCGRLIGLATSSTTIAALMAAGAMLAWICERRKAEAALHVAAVAALSFVAGSAILMCVWRYGGFDSANDAFTYLAQANWLQTHAFKDTIAPADIEPNSIPIAHYQRVGLRMGASYLLASVQAMAGQQWSYVAYPAVISAAASAFSFATVFAASLFVRIRPVHGYLLTCIPGISVGAAVFGLIRGFLPQELGSAAALAFLALAGALLAEFTRPPGSLARTAHWGAGLILGSLFAVVIISYSEESPFVAVAVLLAAGIVFVVASANVLQLLKLTGVSLLVAAVLLNTEALRAVQAIIMQAGTKVGWPINWSIVEFLGHALGIHGGSGDAIEWIGWSAAVDIALMVGLAVLILWTWRHPTRRDVTIALPLLCFAGLCVVAFIYFRYWAASPFPVGTGQSWSEFKLANWVYAVGAVLIAATLAHLISRLRSSLATAILAIALIDGLLRNYSAAEFRMTPVTNQLAADRPIFATLLNIRANVMQHLQPGETVYLDMNGESITLRQLLAYMLYDLPVTANWLDFSPWLSPEKRNPSRKLATYIVAPVAKVPAAVQQKMIWRIGRIGMVADQDYYYVAIESVDGGYGQDTDGNRRWFWVKDQVVFTLSEINDGKDDVSSRRISFEYGMTSKGNMTVEIVGTNDRLELELPQPTGGNGLFDRTLPSSFGRIQRVIIRSDGEPVQLSPKDARMAQFLIVNLEVEMKLSEDSRK